jgi:hypothetical protein
MRITGGKITTLNWATRFLMVQVPLMFLSEWHEFPCLASQEKET